MKSEGDTFIEIATVTDGTAQQSQTKWNKLETMPDIPTPNKKTWYQKRNKRNAKQNKEEGAKDDEEEEEEEEGKEEKLK